MRNLLYTVIVLIYTGNIFGQEYNIDSLKSILSQTKTDTNSVHILNEIAEGYFFYHPDSTYWFAHEAMLQAEQLKDQKGMAVSLDFMGMSLRQMGNYPGALRMLLQSLKVCEKEKFNEDLYRIFHHIASIYYFQKDDRKCIDYELKALAANKKNEDVARSNDYIAGAYEDMNLMDSSLYYQNLSCAASFRLKDPEPIAFNEVNLADVYFKLNKDQLALKYYSLAMPFLTANKINEALCEVAYYKGKIFERQNKPDSALYYGQQSLAYANFSLLTSRQLDASNFLASFYEGRHNADSSLKYLKLSVTLKDSIFNREKVAALQNLTFEENVRQQEIADQKKRDEENHIRNLQLLAIGVFIPIFFLGVLMLSRTKVKPRIVEFLGILSLLLFFEFITDLIYPLVSQWTNENPIWEMAFLVMIAALLEPLNFKLEHWVKSHLVHKAIPAPIALTG